MVKNERGVMMHLDPHLDMVCSNYIAVPACDC